MLSQQLDLTGQSQRVRVEAEATAAGPRVKIRLEQYEDRLGWYTASSLSLPLHQLPLLEQAVAEMRDSQSAECAACGNIIRFPAMGA